ncbi:unnamed protein product [Amoebophrya sp. A120]|nr:unnamed protein product [Amoebophrya sp. A120]|eukprot:GSA120T00011291001.1
MAAIPVSELSQAQKDELICTYSALILHDSEADITADAMTSVIKAAGLSVESYWPKLYSSMVAGKDVGAILKAGGGGGGGVAAAGGAAAGGAAGGDAGEEKKDDAPPEEEEEEMEFDLFD